MCIRDRDHPAQDGPSPQRYGAGLGRTRPVLDRAHPTDVWTARTFLPGLVGDPGAHSRLAGFRPRKGRNAMKLSTLEIILQELDSAGVRYLVAGGVATNAYGYQRLTQDLDLVIGMHRANILGAPVSYTHL